jgi:hypothetical protein
MKTRFVLVGLISCFVLGSIFTSCNKLKDLVKFNIPLQTADVSFTIAPQPVGTQTLAGFQVGINLDSILKAENSSLSISNIKSVKVTACTITTSNATTADHFGDLSACQVAIASGSASTFTKVAEITSNPDTYATTLTIPVSDVELKDYFTTSLLKYQLSGTVRKATTTTLNCTATIKFEIEAGL